MRKTTELSETGQVGRVGARLSILLLALVGCGGGQEGRWTAQKAKAIAVDTTANAIGRLTSVGNGDTRSFNQYDALGRATKTQYVMDGASYVFATAYGYPQNAVAVTGPGSVVTSFTFPDSEVVAYTYDAGGAQQSIKTTVPGSPQQTIVESVTRNARGQTTRVVYGDGTATTHSYHEGTSTCTRNDLRLCGIKTAQVASPFTVIQDSLYDSDANGNITSVQDSFDTTKSSTYEYNSRDELTKATQGGVPYSYDYDNISNLTLKAGAVQKYEDPLHKHAISSQIVGSFTTTYQYDGNGNLLSSSDGLSIDWNCENMAVRTRRGATVLSQKSFLGEAVWKKMEGSITTYHLPSMRIEGGRARKYYGSFAERDPDDASCPNGCLRFYHGDHLGSSTLVTDQSGGVVHRAAYRAYGEDWATSGTFTPKYQFNFKEKETSGLYDYGARMYNPATGRWLSADTRTDDGLNRYAYARNNPLRYIDPTGHLTIVIHGTWANKEQWKTNGIVKRVGETFNDKHTILFEWSGRNLSKDREDASKRLATLIKAYHFAKGEKLNIVAHSHGGNVGFDVSRLIKNHKIDVMVTLGTPAREDYRPNMKMIRDLVGVYSFHDSIQIHAGCCSVRGQAIDIGEEGPAGRGWNGPNVLNVDATSEAGGHHDLWAKPAVWEKIVAPQLSGIFLDQKMEDQGWAHRVQPASNALSVWP